MTLVCDFQEFNSKIIQRSKYIDIENYILIFTINMSISEISIYLKDIIGIDRR